MKKPKNEYKKEFPIEACPVQVQQVARLLNDHYGLPLGTGAVMGLTVALAAAGNRRTLSGAPLSPCSASIFSLIEIPPYSRFEDAIDWIADRIRYERISLQTDHILSGVGRIAWAARGKTDEPIEIIDNDEIKDTAWWLNSEVLAACPEIMLSEIGRLPVWQDAIGHSFDHGILSAASHETMCSLYGMLAEDRQALLRWLGQIWSGQSSDSGDLPNQVVLLWTADPDRPHSTHYLFVKENESFPAFVVPWRRQEARETGSEGPPDDCDWSKWIGELIQRREVAEITRFDIQTHQSDEITVRLHTRLDTEYQEDPAPVELAVTIAQRLAILFASVDDLQTPAKAVTPEHMERGAAIACWLLNQHLGWLATFEFQDVKQECDDPPDILIRSFHRRGVVNPNSIHRILSNRETV